MVCVPEKWGSLSQEELTNGGRVTIMNNVQNQARGRALRF